MSGTRIRHYEKAGADAVATINSAAFRGLEYRPRIRLGMELVSEGSFLAETEEEIVGCVGLVKLGQDGWFEIRYLALKHQIEGKKREL